MISPARRAATPPAVADRPRPRAGIRLRSSTPCGSGSTSQEAPDLLFRGRPLALRRRSAAHRQLGDLLLGRRWYGNSNNGCHTPNTANGIANSRDKPLARSPLRHNIGIPPTTRARPRRCQRRDRAGGRGAGGHQPLEGKPRDRRHPHPRSRSPRRSSKTLHSTRQNVLIQKFVAESRRA